MNNNGTYITQSNINQKAKSKTLKIVVITSSILLQCLSFYKTMFHVNITGAFRCAGVENLHCFALFALSPHAAYVVHTEQVTSCPWIMSKHPLALQRPLFGNCCCSSSSSSLTD